MASTLPNPYGSSRLAQGLLAIIIVAISVNLTSGSFTSTIKNLQNAITETQTRTSGLEPGEMNIAAPMTSSFICADPPLDNCTFYAHCLEYRYHCGPAGYPIGYGQHYCEKFSAQRAELSPSGQSWMLNTMHCLQTQLVPEATGIVVGVTCESLKKKAFESHAGCYVKNGLCTLSPTDWLMIVHIVGLKTLFASREAFLATLDVAKGCLKEYLSFPEALIS